MSESGLLFMLASILANPTLGRNWALVFHHGGLIPSVIFGSLLPPYTGNLTFLCHASPLGFRINRTPKNMKWGRKCHAGPSLIRVTRSSSWGSMNVESNKEMKSNGKEWDENFSGKGTDIFLA